MTNPRGRPRFDDLLTPAEWRVLEAVRNCGGLRLFLSEGDGEADSILYFRVDDIRGAHAALAARGIEFTRAPHLIHTRADGTEEWMAFFKDNDGRPLALMAQLEP